MTTITRNAQTLVNILDQDHDGNLSADWELAPAALPALGSGYTIPTGEVMSALVTAANRRPDVAAALAATRSLIATELAASARSQAAHEDRFPSVSLSGREKLTIKLAVGFVTVVAAGLLILLMGFIGVLIAAPALTGVFALLSLLDRPGPSFNEHEAARRKYADADLIYRREHAKTRASAEAILRMISEVRSTPAPTTLPAPATSGVRS